jgi:hypothetical protein
MTMLIVEQEEEEEQQRQRHQVSVFLCQPHAACHEDYLRAFFPLAAAPQSIAKTDVSHKALPDTQLG